jgi:hypothetical protein
MSVIHDDAEPAARLVPVVSTGRAGRPFTLVALADGFDEAELPLFAAAVLALRAELHATAPFSTLRGLVDIARVDRIGPADVVSGTDLSDDRLLVVDEDRARRATAAAGAAADVVVVVANTTTYAGYGGTGVAATTLHEQGARLAVHELGHAAFDLADEYGGDGPAASGDGEPHRVNVSRVGDPSRVKWADLVTADGQVGCYEGGDRTAYGIYRPSLRCRMRSVHEPFCPVCAREISRVLVSGSQGHALR